MGISAPSQDSCFSLSCVTEVSNVAQPSTQRTEWNISLSPCSTFWLCGLLTTSRALPPLWYVCQGWQYTTAFLAGFWIMKSQWFFSFPAFDKCFTRCLAVPWVFRRGEIENFLHTRYFVFLGYTLLHHIAKVCRSVSSHILPSFSWDLLSRCRQNTGNVVETETMFSKPGDCKTYFEP